MGRWGLEPFGTLLGRIEVPGDKSISHRALMLAAVAAETSHVGGLPQGEDVRSTAACLRHLGIDIDASADGSACVRGAGIDGLRPSTVPLPCGNSGTTMRLLAGLVAGSAFGTILDGDRSLRSRPMERIAEPLRAMGATVITRAGGRPPLEVQGARLRGVTYRTPVPSAQVKSCVLLAGLHADGDTVVHEERLSRDHTERMLASMGAEITGGAADGGVRLRPRPRLGALQGRVPGDVSSAAYWVAAASVAEHADLELPGVGVNPTRSAVLGVLREWGAAIEIEPQAEWHGEPCASLRVRSDSGLRGGVIEAEAVTGLIDELPLLALIGPLTDEGVEIRGAAELRVKESDRITSVCAALRALGAQVDEFPDGLAVPGRQGLTGGTVDACGDHRIALATAAVAGAASGPIEVRGADAAAVSYPGFLEQLRSAASR
ncbi:MAG TPA: 3-phosphoshikimate 1-carboxyvinyltransferase [Acidobacteriota bacterium]|nr:3-phosphoshikimate 1-carboxyvinyltransferase [Acidobacteriota bacterium]